MNKIDLIDRLKAQRDQLTVLISELEASDGDLLANTPIADLSPQQFRTLCSEAMSQAMKPIAVATAEAAHTVIENSKFEDEAERLSGVRRSRSVVGHLSDEEDKGN